MNLSPRNKMDDEEIPQKRREKAVTTSSQAMPSPILKRATSAKSVKKRAFFKKSADGTQDDSSKLDAPLFLYYQTIIVCLRCNQHFFLFSLLLLTLIH